MEGGGVKCKDVGGRGDEGMKKACAAPGKGNTRLILCRILYRISGGGLCRRHGGDLFHGHRGHHGHGRDRRVRLRCRCVMSWLFLS